MMLKLKKKDHPQIETEDLAAKLSEINREKDYFLLSIQTLLQLIKEFALDLKEIDSDGFKKHVSLLSEKFASEKKLKKIQSRFEKEEKAIDSFINLQKNILLTGKMSLRISSISCPRPWSPLIQKTRNTIRKF